MTEIAPGSAGRILVVEDEPAIRLFYERFFRPLGYEVRAVAYAEDARELVLSETEEFDVLILDVQMPGIGGAGLWRFLGENRPEYRSRVVWVTGDILGSRTQKIIDESGQPHLFKPFENRELRRHVEEIVARVQRERRRNQQRNRGLGA